MSFPVSVQGLDYSTLLINSMCLAANIPRSSDLWSGALLAKPMSLRDSENSEGLGTYSRGSVNSHIRKTLQESILL